jgi:hypothetical protein
MAKMTFEEAKRELQFQAVISGGVTQINGKRWTSDGGFILLDGVRVEDPETEVFQHVEVDEA